MITLVGISGSLRRDSFNTALLKTAQVLLPTDVTLTIANLHDIPLYNQDIEDSSGIPAAVQTLKKQIIDAQGILIATPEYNASMSGVLKNTIDWLTRPTSDIPKIFKRKPLAMMGATQGNLGTALAQTAWLSAWRNLGVNVFLEQRLYISNANAVFAEGQLQDAKLRDNLQRFLAEFVGFATR